MTKFAKHVQTGKVIPVQDRMLPRLLSTKLYKEVPIYQFMPERTAENAWFFSIRLILDECQEILNANKFRYKNTLAGNMNNNLYSHLQAIAKENFLDIHSLDDLKETFAVYIEMTNR